MQALPAPNWEAAAEEEYVAPADELEAQIQAVWQEVLLQERISTQSDFFTVGGNSLQARHPRSACTGRGQAMRGWQSARGFKKSSR